MLRDQDRLEAAVTGTWHVDAHRACASLNGLGTLAVALVRSRLGLGCAGGVAKGAQLGAHCALMSAFLKAEDSAFTASPVVGPVTNFELVVTPISIRRYRLHRTTSLAAYPSGTARTVQKGAAQLTQDLHGGHDARNSGVMKAPVGMALSLVRSTVSWPDRAFTKRKTGPKDPRTQSTIKWMRLRRFSKSVPMMVIGLPAKSTCD